MKETKELKEYRKNAKVVAKDFGYDEVMPDVIKKINLAKTESEISRILTTCRHMV